jgi:hypothetical protein
MRSILVGTLLLLLVPISRGAEEENPLRKAKVGDWVEYRMTGKDTEGTTKMTIVTKTDKEVTYEIESTFSFMGNKQSAVQRQTVDLTKPWDMISARNIKENNVQLEKISEGRESLEAGGKKYETKWKKLKSTTTTSGFTVVVEHKMWFSPEVPVTGMVRLDTTTGDSATKIEVVASGHK